MTRLADHLVVLQQGRVAAHGPVGEVFSRMDAPQLVGSDASVIWQGKVLERKAQWHLARIACAGGDLWVRDTGDAPGLQMRVRILARDVGLTLSRHEDSSILNRLPVSVLEIATDKEAGMALVGLQAGSDVVTAQVTHRSVDYLKLAPGQRLWAQIKSVAILR
ncbi:MAG: TOBE domain-containing protein [Pseudomonadota bacterium]|nr:TOBE domain-containing protein [Pseudomonadota bacterium]